MDVSFGSSNCFTNLPRSINGSPRSASTLRSSERRVISFTGKFCPNCHLEFRSSCHPEFCSSCHPERSEGPAFWSSRLVKGSGFGLRSQRPTFASEVVVLVPLLRQLTLVHLPLLGEVGRTLVPKDRAPLAHVVHQLRLALQQVANELGRFRFVMAGRQ